MTAQPAHIARADASVYYNEIDPYCAAWLQNLMDAGQIPRGVIDTRSIEDVRPDELAGFTQCHFFAGLGGWAYALQLAGWSARPVWTGSCPCQPFSAAGKGAGFADERHLWPAWQHLIAQCRPAVVFGEQVASKDADPWIDLVQADLESMGYAFGCVPFPSAGVGAPHIRDRNYWVADADSEGLAQRVGDRRVQSEAFLASAWKTFDSGRSACRMGDAKLPEKARQRQHGGALVSVKEAEGSGLPGALNGFWGNGQWVACADGKSRPVEPGSFPLAHGIPNRVGRLRAYGNAINAEVATAFIESYCEARGLIALEAAA